MKTNFSEWLKWPKVTGLYLVKTDFGPKHGGKSIKLMVIENGANGVLLARSQGYNWRFTRLTKDLRFHPFHEVIVDKNKVPVTL